MYEFDGGSEDGNEYGFYRGEDKSQREGKK